MTCQTRLRGPNADTQELFRAAFSVPAPDCLVSVIAPDATLPANHPAADKPMIGGRATAYVCVGLVCGMPVTAAAHLIDVLK